MNLKLKPTHHFALPHTSHDPPHNENMTVILKETYGSAVRRQYIWTLFIPEARSSTAASPRCPPTPDSYGVLSTTSNAEPQLPSESEHHGNNLRPNEQALGPRILNSEGEHEQCQNKNPLLITETT